MTAIKKTQKRERRHKRIRARVFGTAERPRLSIFRSNKFIYGQIINDETGKTLASVSDMQVKKTKAIKGKLESSKTVGLELADRKSVV